MIPRFKAGQDEHQWANALLEVGAIIIEQAATEATIDAFNRDLQVFNFLKILHQRPASLAGCLYHNV